jgi:hypothetical protein
MATRLLRRLFAADVTSLRHLAKLNYIDWAGTSDHG